MSEYCKPEDMAAMRKAGLIREETQDEKWLREQLYRVSPHWDEQGNDAGYTQALIALVFEQRKEINAIRHDHRLEFEQDRSSSLEKRISEQAIAKLADQERADKAEARIADLEAQLSAIGAGGVEPLRKASAPPDHFVDADKMVREPLADELRIARGAIRELEAKVFSQEQALAVLHASVDSYRRDLSNPPGYLQDVVIKAAGLGAMAEQIAALKAAADRIQPVRKPLTDEHVRSLWIAAEPDKDHSASWCFARAIERAHGIGVTTDHTSAPKESTPYPDTHTKFRHGQQVAKPKGAHWSGRVCGWYSTELTQEGYNVVSTSPDSLHSVQVYPASALVLAEGGAQ